MASNQLVGGSNPSSRAINFMKIFKHLYATPELNDWGISVPLLKSRGDKISEELDQVHLIPESKNITKEDLLRVHNLNFVNNLFDPSKIDQIMMDCYELINHDGSYNRFNPNNKQKTFSELRDCHLNEVEGTFFCSNEALRSNSNVFFLGGGMHHAMSFGGRGFCLVNDLIISIRKLQFEKKIKTAWIIDVDAHKGDGTAELTKEDNSIISLSVHMQNGWPLDSDQLGPWNIASNIDVEIAEGQDNYLDKLKQALKQLTNNFETPDLIYIVDGADPYEFDQLESAKLLKLSKEALLQRDLLLYGFCRELSIPSIWVMAGGYGERSWEIYTNFLNKIRHS